MNVRPDLSDGYGHMAEMALCVARGRFGVSSLLQIDVNDLTILIHSAPKVMLLPADLHEQFVQKVSIAKARMSAAKSFGKLRAEFIDPESNGFVTDINTSLSQKISNISDAEIESIAEPDGVLNDRRWETMSFVDVFHLGVLP